MLPIIPLLYSIVAFAITLCYFGSDNLLRCNHFGYCSRCTWRGFCKLLGLYNIQFSLGKEAERAVAGKSRAVYTALIIVGYITAVVIPLASPSTYTTYKVAYITSIIGSLPWMILSFKSMASPAHMTGYSSGSRAV